MSYYLKSFLWCSCVKYIITENDWTLSYREKFAGFIFVQNTYYDTVKNTLTINMIVREKNPTAYILIEQHCSNNISCLW